MVLFSMWPRSSSVGHYETVGVKRRGDTTGTARDRGLLQTLFPAGDPLLMKLHRLAVERSDPKTMENLVVTHLVYPAVVFAVGRPDPLPGREPISCDVDMAALSSPAMSVPVDDTRRVSGRHRTPSTKQRENEVTSSSRSPRAHKPQRSSSSVRRAAPSSSSSGAARVARSLSHQLDRAAGVAAVVDPASSSCAGSSPARRSPKANTASHLATSQRSSTVQAAPRHPQLDRDRLCGLGDRAIADLCKWIRDNTARGCIARRVSFHNIPLWTTRCRVALQRLAAALRKEPMDEREVITHLCVVWLLPHAVFGAPGRYRGGRRGRMQRWNRIVHRLNDPQLVDGLAQQVQARIETHGGDVQSGLSLLTSASAIYEASPDLATSQLGEQVGAGMAGGTVAPSSSPRESLTEDQKVARRVEHLFRNAHTHRALRTLTSTTTLADLNVPEERAILHALHPPCPLRDDPDGTLSVQERSAMPLCPSPGDTALVVDFDAVQDQMRASDTGAAAGPSGYGSNYISVLADDPYCVEALGVLLQCIVNNTLPDTVRKLLTTCILVSLDKGNGGRRPVAMGELFARMAGRYVLALVTDKAKAALSPYQYGVGNPDGCAQIVHSIRHLLCQENTEGVNTSPRVAIPSTRRPLACLSIDMKNAFNSLNRRVMLETVYANDGLRACWNMVAFGYGQTSLLFMHCDETVNDREAFLESSNGVRQGDPLAAMLFCLAMHSTYHSIAEVMSAGCYAYVDDSHAVGTLEECWKVWERLPSLLAPLGLTINTAKCELTCFYTDELTDEGDRAALERFREVLPNTINTQSFRLLGSVIGVDDAREAAALHSHTRFCADQLVAFRRLPFLRKPTAMLALQQLTGTVLTHRLRAMSPAAVASHAARYDELVQHTAHVVIGVPECDGDRYDGQLRWPMRNGGLGLTSAMDIAPAAFLAGVECALRRSPAFSSMWSGSTPLDPTSRLYASINDCLNRIRQAANTLTTLIDADDHSQLHLPASASTFVSHFRALPPSLRYQSDVTSRISTLSYNASLAQARRDKTAMAEVARLQSLQAKESSLWLRTLPTMDALQLSDVDWQWCARLRLGMPMPFGASPPLGCQHTDAQHESWHPLSCSHAYGALITKRHTAVLQVIAHHCRLILLNPRIEPSDLCADRSKRPDIQVDLPGLSLLGDVTIIHPTCRSWRKITAKRGVTAAGDKKAAKKTSHYTSLVDQHRSDVAFEPIVLYTYGGFHASALRFINKLAKAVDPATSLISPSAWKRSLMQHIAIVVQRGTALIMRAHVERYRAEEVERWFNAADAAVTHGAVAASSMAPSSAASWCRTTGVPLFSPPRIGFYGDGGGVAATTLINDGLVTSTWSARTVAERDAEEDVTGLGDLSDIDGDDAVPGSLEGDAKDREDRQLVSSHETSASGNENARECVLMELTDEDELRGRVAVSIAESRDDVMVTALSSDSALCNTTVDDCVCFPSGISAVVHDGDGCVNGAVVGDCGILGMKG
jgi:hypothetical protein